MHYTLHSTYYILHAAPYMLRTTHYTQNTTHYTIYTAKCTLQTLCNKIIFLFFIFQTGMTGDPARKVIPVLISSKPGPRLWRAKTRTCHSQDPEQTNRVTRNVPSRNPVSDTWCLHAERNGLSRRLNDASQGKGQSCLFSPECPVNALRRRRGRGAREEAGRVMEEVWRPGLV